MNKHFVMLAVVTLSTAALAQEMTKPAAREGVTPMMVSFTDLKWTELPERKGMQFAVLSGDPKKGEYTQMRKVPAGTANPLHTHSSEIKNVIISGVWYTGADAASARFRPRVDRDDASQLDACSGCHAGSDCVFYQDGKGKFDFRPAASRTPAGNSSRRRCTLHRPSSWCNRLISSIECTARRWMIGLVPIQASTANRSFSAESKTTTVGWIGG